MKLAILTSSRADFGFYRPLLDILAMEASIEANLIVFGTHLSEKHGYTIKEIEEDGYKIFAKITCLPEGDKPSHIVKNIGELHVEFARFWGDNCFDLIICIGDRFEMFAAVSASVPFNIPVAHISGGEETLGAIDNTYRHMLSMMSSYHFTNTLKNANKVKSMIGDSKGVFYTGSLAVDNIQNTKLYTSTEFESKFGFDINQHFILFTFHPETVNYKVNVEYAKIIKGVLDETNVPILVTMPNSDTAGEVIRTALIGATELNAKVFLVESLGSKGYYAAMKNCMLVLGNSSSGIIEAASFGKYVINIGRRQKGREFGNNVFHCEINKEDIKESIERVIDMPALGYDNIYGSGDASRRIVEVLKNI